LNGVKYPAEGFEDDHASPRSTEEKTHTLSKKSHHRPRSAGTTYNLRGKERVSQVPKEMRTRTGTDYRQLLLHKNVEQPIHEQRSMIDRWMDGAEFLEDPTEQRSMIDRWMDGAEFLKDPEVEPVEEPVEEPEEMQCHPVGWTKKNHYSELGWQWCGQSCPCCRARVGDTLGACPVCIRERK
jgi:hypothetical protein